MNLFKENDFLALPDAVRRFISDDDLEKFRQALNTPEALPLVAINDWMPIHQRVRKSRNQKKRRSKDETREGSFYNILKWPLLLTALGWIIVLAFLYLLTRYYIHLYEHFVTWRGRRQDLRGKLQQTNTYVEWKTAARALDRYLGNDRWKENDEYAYYDYVTVAKITAQLRWLRIRAEKAESGNDVDFDSGSPIDELRVMIEGCVRSNFAGTENIGLYSETYLGTKNLVQEFLDEVHASLELLLRTKHLAVEDKSSLFQHLDRNYGRTALCLSGGATFAYYHFGVVKALLDEDVLPDIISGTSGGALVAALVATRTDDELKQLLIPALAHKIDACEDPFIVWFRRWWRTGARFDAVDWAEKCSWFCRGSTTFLEAYKRTGRVLNVSCVPSDPHSPTILANYVTSPNCVIWSAVIASAAVPGILNPVVLMMKKPDGSIAPYSFGHKWKDGSLRTDIPLKSLNLHLNVNFPIVSQVNPHISLFFFNSRGSIGRPVSHRKGRGWRGGFIGSAIEQYIKLDLTKWLKVLRHLELLPRPLGQDWSAIWLQRFSGTVTIWPKSHLGDLPSILSDPDPDKLGRMILEGQRVTFPKILFIANRIGIERIIHEGRKLGSDNRSPKSHHAEALYDGNMLGYSRQRPRQRRGLRGSKTDSSTTATSDSDVPSVPEGPLKVFEEIRRQSAVFFDDTDDTVASEDDSAGMRRR